jgi:hypothetical protein
LNKGVIFLHEQELLVTGNHWNIVVNINVKWFRDTLTRLKLVWRQLEVYAAKPEGAGMINWKELSRVHDITTDLDDEIQNLERLLPYKQAKNPRKRRGLIDFGGQVLKCLFGTATYSEVQDLQSIVSKYEDQSDDTIHALKAQLTLIRIVDKETRQNTVDLLEQAS